MKLTSAFLCIVATVGTNAWHVTFTDKNDFCGTRRTFYSSQGENGCYNVPDDVAADVHSGAFCTMPWTRCSVTLHSEPACKGDVLGSSDAAWPSTWENPSITSANKRAVSFRIQGCKKIGTTLDITNCWDSEAEEPWNQCDD